MRASVAKKDYVEVANGDITNGRGCIYWYSICTTKEAAVATKMKKSALVLNRYELDTRTGQSSA